MFGMVQEGSRGLHAPEEDGDINENEYGIDWEALERNPTALDDQLEQVAMEHPLEGAPHNAPRNLAHVPCEPPNCPFDEDDIARLDAHMLAEFPEHSRVMLRRREMWCSALDFCKLISAEF